MALLIFPNNIFGEQIDPDLKMISANRFWNDAKFISIVKIDVNGATEESIIKGEKPDGVFRAVILSLTKRLEKRVKIDPKIAGVAICQLQRQPEDEIRVIYIDRSGTFRGENFDLDSLTDISIEKK